jgi:hypothetical protein
MKIEFSTPKEVVTTKEVKSMFESITVMSIIDRPASKSVTVNILEGDAITLWEGTDYDAIGQWTDADVLNKLKRLYS